MTKDKKAEIRKIQLTGGSTYTLSLPKKWIQKMDLNTGEGMRVEERGSYLMLSPAKLRKKEKNQEAQVEVGENDNLGAINRKILSLYLMGYNSINIESNDTRLSSAQKRSIKDFVRNKLVGTEIISESMEKITLKTLLSYSELSVKGALKRMYRISTSMQENAMTALKENDKRLANDVIEIDDEVDRFQMYLIREIKAAIQNPSLIEEIGLKTLRECFGYRLVSNSVERVGDHAALMAKNVLDIESPISEDPMEMLVEINSLAESILKKSIDSLLEEDYDSAEEVIGKLDKVHQLENEMNHYLAEEKPKEAIRIRLILESIRRIAEYGSDIAEIVLNLTVVENDYSF